MKKLMVYLREDDYEALREFALRKRTSITALVRYAVDKTFEEELDTIAGEQALEEALRDPSSTMTLEEYMRERGIAVPDRTESKRQARPQRAAV